METITINDVEYTVADLDPKVIALINRVTHLRSRIADAQQTVEELSFLVDSYGATIVEMLPNPDQQELDV